MRIIIFTFVIILLGIYEILDLKKKGQTKDIYVYIGLMLPTAALGYYYLSDIYRESFIAALFNLLGLSY